MKRLLILPIAFLLIAGACSTPQSDTMLVAVSILPQQEFVEQIAGEFPIEVMVMIPPGASPATYELTPKQMQQISKAKAYFCLGSGLPFENVWLDKIKGLNPSMKVYDCSEGIELIGGFEHKHGDHVHHGVDPHIWTSPANAKTMVENITRGLIEIDPEHKQVYEKNSPIYISKLAEAHREIEKKLIIINKRDFIIFHPAWGYFAADYGLNQVAIEIEGKDPRAEDLKNLVELARDRDIKTIFASPQFNAESAEMIAREIGGQVELIDPLAKSYITNLSEVASKLTKAMR